MNGVSYNQLNNIYAAFIKNNQNCIPTPSQNDEYKRKAHIKTIETTGGVLVLTLLLIIAGRGRYSGIIEKLNKQQEKISQTLKNTNLSWQQILIEKSKGFAIGAMNIHFNVEQRIKFQMLSALEKFAPTKFVMNKMNNFFIKMAEGAVKSKYSKFSQESEDLGHIFQNMLNQNQNQKKKLLKS